MNLVSINYEQDNDLKVSFKVDTDFRFLFCRPVGMIKTGTKGNVSADYLFGKICQYYFQMECLVLILDFSKLEYEYGDRLRKSINFFKEVGRDEEEKAKPMILIKPKRTEAVNSLIDWIKPVNLTVAENEDEAIEIGAELFNGLIE